MSGLLQTGLMAAASLCGGAACAAATRCLASRKLRAQRRARALERQAPAVSGMQDTVLRSRVLRYGERLARQLFIGSAMPLSPAVRAKRADRTRSGAWYRDRRDRAGTSKVLSIAAFCELRARLAAAGALMGFLLGLALSVEMSLALACLGGALGAALPFLAIRQAVGRRAAMAEEHLSEMLEVVALGLRSGLTFDRGFALYGAYFDNEFSRSCTRAYRSWSLGLCSRQEALRDLAASYDVPALSRVVDSILRSLRFGSALAGVLDEAGRQARASCKAALEERVAKAPVKMMLPTGALILPAMLLLILGPVLLELSGGF